MRVKVESYWTKISPGNGSISDFEGDGKWVAFIRRHFIGPRRNETRRLVDTVGHLVDDHQLLGAYVTTRNQDVVVVFTTADRYEIARVKQLLQSELSIDSSDLFWKAHFETDIDWKIRSGKLWFINRIVSSFFRKENALLSNRQRKADGIQRKEIEPTISQFRKAILEESTLNRNSMVIKPLFPGIDYKIDPMTIFVLMPFGEEWSDEIHFLIKQVGKKHGLQVLRADDIFEPHIIVNDIWSSINRAGLIIADITVHNANVFYELGIAHTLGKEVVLIRQKGGEKTPFDISFWRFFEYELVPTKAEDFKDTLSKIIMNYLARIQAS